LFSAAGASRTFICGVWAEKTPFADMGGGKQHEIGCSQCRRIERNSDRSRYQRGE
jgi:hypothetical protein